jgi:hypothetical protein
VDQDREWMEWVAVKASSYQAQVSRTNYSGTSLLELA